MTGLALQNSSFGNTSSFVLETGKYQNPESQQEAMNTEAIYAFLL